MAQVILVTGGSRSGKSGYAQSRAESLPGKKLYIATCPKVDTELDDRIARHIQDRQGKGWQTLEEEIELNLAVKNNISSEILLIDCLTLWINNLLYYNRRSGRSFGENEAAALCSQILLACGDHSGTIFFVTNEIGSGIIPESPETRLYRDIVGRCNQIIAAGADEVVLVSCGIPLFLKS